MLLNMEYFLLLDIFQELEQSRRKQEKVEGAQA